jgi:hypothetical protein
MQPRDRIPVAQADQIGIRLLQRSLLLDSRLVWKRLEGTFRRRSLEPLTPELHPGGRRLGLDFYPLVAPGERFPINDELSVKTLRETVIAKASLRNSASIFSVS